MIKNLTLVLLLSFTSFVVAQKVTYNLPKQITNKNIRITFKKVSTSTSSYFINYKAENIGDGIFVIDRGLTDLALNNAHLYPTSDTYVLKPGTNKTVYNQFRIKSGQAKSDLLKLQLNGLNYAKFSTPLKAEKLVLAEKATQTIDQFTIKVMEYNVYSDRVYAQIKCTFNGNMKSVANIDLSSITVKGGNAEIVKKGGVLFPSKSYSFAINITPNGEELSINLNNVLSIGKLKNIKLEDILIKSTNYKEEEPAEEVKEEPVEEEEKEILELSYSDFTKLKNDIKVEMDNGGKPIDMAYEFLLEKKHMSTAQVIEILEVFNLDGSRLKFAKMAYAFTSDQPKYHMVVGKLAYTKNKQALEEFLENTKQ